MNSKPLVSICCITYNHENFIDKCLDSLISQKTNFPFEIIINDDASCDKTTEIIKKYEQKYPNIIKASYQTENQYSKGIGILKNFVLPKIKGKYVAICEGDDYWTDDNKLQKQVDFLEKHKDYSICFHPVKVFYENKENKNFAFPTRKMIAKGFTFEKLLKGNFIQTNSVMYRWNFKGDEIKDIIPNNMLPQDWYIHLLMAKEGKIGFINETMSVYRRHEGGIWYDNSGSNSNINRKHGMKILNFYMNVYKNIANESSEYLREVLLPSFQTIFDNYLMSGDMNKLSETKEKYPKFYEIALKNKQNSTPTRKIKKYKKLFNVFLIVSIVLFIICLILTGVIFYIL